MKKLTSLLMLSLTAGALLSGCGNNDSAPAAQSATAPAAPTKIIIGLDDNFPPMGFRNEKNELVGFDISMATEAARRLGVEAEFKPIDWSAKEAELNGKRVDALWNGLTITDSRGQYRHSAGRLVPSAPPPPQGDGAAGGVIASALDLARFACAFDDPQHCPILSPESIQQMHGRPPGLAGHEPDGTEKDVYYSLGWQNRVLGDGKTPQDQLLNVYKRDPRRAATQLRLANRSRWGNDTLRQEVGVYWQDTDDLFNNMTSHTVTHSRTSGAQWQASVPVTRLTHTRQQIEHRVKACADAPRGEIFWTHDKIAAPNAQLINQPIDGITWTLHRRQVLHQH